jgi:hypothetical protein
LPQPRLGSHEKQRIPLGVLLHRAEESFQFLEREKIDVRGGSLSSSIFGTPARTSISCA